MRRRIILLITLIFLQTVLGPGTGEAKYKDWDKYIERYQQENKYLQSEGGLIVFLGDSLTEYFPLDELRKRYNIINRGIRMDAVADAYSRLKVSVLDLKPQTVFIMLGTNDVCAYWLPPEEILARYQKLLERIKAALPDSKIVVQSVLLTRNPAWNDYIRPLNTGLAQLCQQMDLVFLDHNQVLTEGDRLAARLTGDGIHLRQAGYDLLADNIRRYLESPVVVKYQGRLVFSRLGSYQGQPEVLVNLRSFAQATGGTVQWSNGQARLIKGGREFSWTVGQKVAVLDGKELVLDIPPAVVNNSLYVPLNPLAEAMGYTVNSAADKKTFTINDAQVNENITKK
ncbi:lipolytic protein G-D-S-L family [Desulfotomaculum nigrificans CO-1-SRB]|uniref:Lipolytic protein G-D-S-L family n=1 Tax=Desulfotomaculum nigrificans (strain DSM 14880 / VKM B-2319 / CO-1-SRB) TaxID=868595 RepID=F6B5J1_DESCC|nr:GDSL-type esterase/lipase family protein [Desulfotomaculum nigrificans]AEF95423.1 lipolytic protein G-D-S-L family [Desulfotomaculum nigrificans CO-1-SRB]